MSCAGFVPRQAGDDFNWTFVLLDPVSQEGVTGLTAGDLTVKMWDDVNGVTTLSIDALTELDAGDSPGWYRLKILAAEFDESARFSAISIQHTAPATIIPCTVNMQQVPYYWPAFFPLFEQIRQRLNDFLDSQGAR